MNLNTLLKVKEDMQNLKDNAGISDVLDLLNDKIDKLKKEQYEDGNKLY